MLESDCKRTLLSRFPFIVIRLYHGVVNSIYCFSLKRWDTRGIGRMQLFVQDPRTPDFRTQVLSQIIIPSHDRDSPQTLSLTSCKAKNSRVTSRNSESRSPKRKLITLLISQKFSWNRELFFTDGDVCLQSWAKKLEATMSIIASHCIYPWKEEKMLLKF